CDSGSHDRRMSSTVVSKASQQAAALLVRLPWLSMTPLASPVVPEVYNIVAKSLGLVCSMADCTIDAAPSLPIAANNSVNGKTGWPTIVESTGSYEKHCRPRGNESFLAASLST